MEQAKTPQAVDVKTQEIHKKPVDGVEVKLAPKVEVGTITKEEPIKRVEGSEPLHAKQ